MSEPMVINAYEHLGDRKQAILSQILNFEGKTLPEVEEFVSGLRSEFVTTFPSEKYESQQHVFGIVYTGGDKPEVMRQWNISNAAEK